MPRYALIDNKRAIVDAFDADGIEAAVKHSLEVSCMGKEVYVQPLTNRMVLKHLAGLLERVADMDTETQQACVDDFDIAFKEGYLTTLFENLEDE